MPQLNLVEAINQALHQEMARDPSTVILGEDVGLNGGVFRVTDGLQKKFGETRVFDVSCNGGRLTRRIELTIEKLDFSYEGVPHSLQFHWVVDGGRARGTDMRYIYSPGRGLASVDED